MTDEPAITVEHDDCTLTHTRVRYVPEDRWQPIETARPTVEGLDCLLFVADAGEDGEVARGHISLSAATGRSHYKARGYGGEGWTISHWQPLPAPPKDA